MNTNDEKILECLKDLEAARLSRKALWPYLVPIFLIGMFMHAMSRHSDSGFLMAFLGAVCCTIAVMSIDVRAKDRQLDALAALLTELTKKSRARSMSDTNGERDAL